MAAAAAACRGLGFPQGGMLSECPGCGLASPLRAGLVACSANDSSLATCGYVALQPFNGREDVAAELATGGGANTAAACIHYNMEVGRSPAVSLSCRADGKHDRALAIGAIVGGSLAALTAMLTGGWAA